MIEAQNELCTRWNKFLNQIEVRFSDSLGHAYDTCKNQLIETDFDYHIVLTTWVGIKAQLMQLIDKIDQTWENQVKNEFYLMGLETVSNYKKAEALSESLREKLEQFQIKLEGNLSLLFYNHSLSLVSKDFYCSQCYAPIQLNPNLFRAQYITCSYCTTVNTIEPEGKFLQIGHNIIDNIITYKLLDQYNVMQQKLNELMQSRFDSKTNDKLWEEYKASYLNYFDSFFKERIKLNPEAEFRFEADINRKIKEFENYESIHRKN